MTSAVEHKHCAIENTTVIIMAARENSSSSEEILSDENSSNECNLYDSVICNLYGVDVGARLFCLEPRRVQRDMQPESNEEDGDSETHRLGKTDWLLFRVVIHSHLYDCYAFEGQKLSLLTESYRESCLLMLLFFSCCNKV